MRTRKFFTAFLALSLFAVLSLTGIFTTRAEAAVTDSGSCGDNLTWSLDGGTLTISGTGNMEDYSYAFISERAPWYSYQNQITTVIINSGVANIGKEAFNYCTSLKSITIPNSVTSIDDYAF